MTWRAPPLGTITTLFRFTRTVSHLNCLSKKREHLRWRWASSGIGIWSAILIEVFTLEL